MSIRITRSVYTEPNNRIKENTLINKTTLKNIKALIREDMARSR